MEDCLYILILDGCYYLRLVQKLNCNSMTPLFLSSD